MNVHGIPSVEAVLQEPAVRALLASLRRDVVVECVRECVAALRDELRGTVGSSDRARLDKPTVAQGDAAELVAARVAERLCPPQRFSLRRVVNATGVIIHTNLGRAPQATPDGFAHVAETIGGYCNLEVDVATGERSHRDVHAAGLLTRLTGAEAATVVNNNAAAVVLTLTALAAGQRVVCSRGELVEIGGSFRLPEIIACSGAHLVEVGTTNHARVRDYEAALTPDTAAIMKIHPSNFRII
ncbi:MAG: L-seryl-tRNA(Sec) selenium transferase, partial [Planctomycetes bacterium]|nr:L-seryl-tRNA(Sec) selenium transferase [Planctomycetota bacterium]